MFHRYSFSVTCQKSGMYSLSTLVCRTLDRPVTDWGVDTNCMSKNCNRLEKIRQRSVESNDYAQDADGPFRLRARIWAVMSIGNGALYIRTIAYKSKLADIPTPRAWEEARICWIWTHSVVLGQCALPPRQPTEPGIFLLLNYKPNGNGTLFISNPKSALAAIRISLLIPFIGV